MYGDTNRRKTLTRRLVLRANEAGAWHRVCYWCERREPRKCRNCDLRADDTAEHVHALILTRTEDTDERSTIYAVVNVGEKTPDEDTDDDRSIGRWHRDTRDALEGWRVAPARAAARERAAMYRNGPNRCTMCKGVYFEENPPHKGLCKVCARDAPIVVRGATKADAARRIGEREDAPPADPFAGDDLGG